MNVHPSRLLRAVAANAAASPMTTHRKMALAALRYEWALTAGERWFLESIQQLSSLSPRQWDTLNEISSKGERCGK